MTNPRPAARAGDRLTFVQAIARQNGMGVNGTPANRNNNPANLHDGPDGAETYYPNTGAGYNALRDVLRKDYLGLTITQALNKYATPFESATNPYIQHVCEWTGMTAETVLTEDNIG